MARGKISIALSDKLQNRLEEAVELTGLSVSEIVRVALHEYLNKEESEHGKGDH